MSDLLDALSGKYRPPPEGAALTRKDLEEALRRAKDLGQPSLIPPAKLRLQFLVRFWRN